MSTSYQRPLFNALYFVYLIGLMDPFNRYVSSFALVLALGGQMPESEVAEVAGVGLLAGVDAHVRRQLMHLRELLAALLALERLLTRVDHLMFVQSLGQ